MRRILGLRGFARSRDSPEVSGNEQRHGEHGRRSRIEEAAHLGEKIQTERSAGFSKIGLLGSLPSIKIESSETDSERSCKGSFGVTTIGTRLKLGIPTCDA